MSEPTARRYLAKLADVNVLLIDNSKITKGKKYKYNLAPLADVDYCVSDVDLTNELAVMPRRGCRKLVLTPLKKEGK